MGLFCVYKALSYQHLARLIRLECTTMILTILGLSSLQEWKLQRRQSVVTNDHCTAQLIEVT